MARGPLTADAHPWIVRATHWLNAVLLGIMIASGLEIFAVWRIGLAAVVAALLGTGLLQSG